MMRIRARMAAVGVVMACSSVASCATELPTDVGATGKRSSAVLLSGNDLTTERGKTSGGIGTFAAEQTVAPPPDTTTRGIGGFGSGN